MAAGKVHICIHAHRMYLRIGDQILQRVVRRRFCTKHTETAQADRAIVAQPAATRVPLSPHGTPVCGQRAGGVPPVYPHSIARFKASKHLRHIALMRLQHSQFISRGQRIDHSATPFYKLRGSLGFGKGSPVHTFFQFSQLRLIDSELHSSVP